MFPAALAVDRKHDQPQHALASDRRCDRSVLGGVIPGRTRQLPYPASVPRGRFLFGDLAFGVEPDQVGRWGVQQADRVG
jgi:hypothetical protein